MRRTLRIVLVLFVVACSIALGAPPVEQEPAPFNEGQAKVEQAASLLALVWEADPATAQRCLDVITRRWRAGELTPDARMSLQKRLQPLLDKVIQVGDPHPLYLDAVFLAGCWKHPLALAGARRIAGDVDRAADLRLSSIATLMSAESVEALDVAASILRDPVESLELRSPLLSLLGQASAPELADVILNDLARWEPELQPKAIDLLAQRPAWSLRLLEAVAQGRLDANLINANQLRQLAASREPRVRALVEQRWGSVRQERNPRREQVVAEMRRLLASKTGDPHAGQQIFHRVCGQCHRMHGAGHEVGPDITVNGRASLAQLLSNVFDPSLVIGAAYQARTVATQDGRVLSGLLVEDSPQRLVLKIQGGKTEILAREDIDEVNVSQLSLMPEGLESQLSADEIVDLFAFLMLDRPPSDPQARRIPGAEELGGE